MVMNSNLKFQIKKGLSNLGFQESGANKSVLEGEATRLNSSVLAPKSLLNALKSTVHSMLITSN